MKNNFLILNKFKSLIINYKLLLLLLLFWKLIDLSISIFARYFIPYLGFFPYRDALEKTGLPKFIYSFANFDGTHYLKIAKNGYDEYAQAFFPLYPLLIKTFAFLKINFLITGLLISNICFFIGFIFLYKLLKLLKLNKNAINWILILLVFFPTSFFFGAIYTEGLFFFLFGGSLYFLKKEKFLWAALFVFFASLTKIIGLLLILPMIFVFYKKLQKANNKFSLPILICTLSPILGLLSYIIYLWKTTGDPLFFLASQPAFGAHRSTNIILLPQVYYRYFKILTTASHNFQYFISLLEVIIFTFFLIVLLLDLKKNFKDSFRLGLNLFSLSNLILPTLTGTFSSIPRYVLLSVSAFIYLGERKNVTGKLILFGVFFILHIVLIGLFIQGYFIG